MNDKQWRYKPDSGSWSITFVIEHLIIHEELFYREVNVISALPQLLSQPDSLFASDESILSYTEITAQNTGKSPWYLEPRGRWDKKDAAIDHYRRVRGEMISFVSNSNVDLRKYYTESGRGPTTYRDLHQLLLISIAHTRRHHTQIQNIKTALPDLE